MWKQPDEQQRVRGGCWPWCGLALNRVGTSPPLNAAKVSALAQQMAPVWFLGGIFEARVRNDGARMRREKRVGTGQDRVAWTYPSPVEASTAAAPHPASSILLGRTKRN